MPGAIDPAEVADLALGLLDVIPVPCPDELRPAMEPYLRLVRNAVAAHTNHGNLLGAAGYFVRRFDSEEAAGYAERADQLISTPAAVIALGLIRRDQDRTDDALRAWDRALTYDPNNLDVYADIGELLLEAGRLTEAQTYAERALQVERVELVDGIVLIIGRSRGDPCTASKLAMLAVSWEFASRRCSCGACMCCVHRVWHPPCPARKLGFVL